MMAQVDQKRQVREFYDQVGWQQVSEGIYQNARYDDLRPVAREYIHNCHLRVSRHLAPAGRYLLDAGSGPIQYPEYLEYSKGYRYRVCADISFVALVEARQRIGEHGLYVVCDIANLPFKPEAFDGVVSLHTIHHLPQEDHVRAYEVLYRALAPGRSAVVVNGWGSSPLMNVLGTPLWAYQRLHKTWKRLRGQPVKPAMPKATFVQKNTPGGLKRALSGKMEIEILVWRSVNVSWMRAFIHEKLGGRAVLRLLYALEERYPRFFGEYGQYPLIVIRKSIGNRAAGES
jgi:SAM-dependent methyltransferase